MSSKLTQDSMSMTFTKEQERNIQTVHKMRKRKRENCFVAGSPRTIIQGGSSITHFADPRNDLQEDVTFRKRRASDEAVEVPSKRRRCSNLTQPFKGSLEDTCIRGRKRKASADDGPLEKGTRCSITGPSVLSDHLKPKKRKARDDGEAPEKKKRRYCFSSSLKVNHPIRDVVDDLVKDFSSIFSKDERICEMSSVENISRGGFKDKYVQLHPISDHSVYAGIRISDCLPVAIQRMNTKHVLVTQMTCNGRVFNVVLEVAVQLKAASLPRPVGQSAAASLLDWYILKDELILVMEKTAQSKEGKAFLKTHEGSLDEPAEQWPRKKCHSSHHQDEVVEVKDKRKEKKVLLANKKAVRASPEKNKAEVVSTKKPLRSQQIKSLGFPNPAQICYMNSCLQSLLTLEEFVHSIDRQEQVLDSSPDAAIMTAFRDIKRAHGSSNRDHKVHLLSSFKNVVSSQYEEFEDLQQKDAHEFLTCVLNQMRSLRPSLQLIAARMGKVYNCPVDDHMLFKMQSTRTCRSCGAGSTREEEYTNLSLNLSPGGGTVEQLLEDYLKETEVEFQCHCGGTTSRQRISFANLPKVLVLHLKRFTYNSTYQLQKVHEPVVLLRDLVVSSNQGGGCFSLVSSINHMGPSATSGHYVCEGVDPDVGQGDPTDRWFTYDDAVVTETSGEAVVSKREKDCYILFYKRMD